MTRIREEKALRTPTERIAWPDAARGLAIALVVFHHSIQFASEAGLSEPAWVVLTEFLRTMRMPLFFMTAGLFAGKWVVVPWRELFRSKVLLFVWVFAIWALIRWGTFNLVPIENEESGWLNLAIHFFIWPLGGWFILALAIFFVVARATAKVDRRIQLGIAAALSVLWFTGPFIGNRAWDGVFLFYLFFIFGCYWRDWVMARAAKLTWWAGAAVLAAWVLSAGALAYFNLGSAPLFGFVLRVLGLASGIVVAVALSRVRPLRALGSKTLPIYMVHSIVVFVTVSVLLALAASSWPYVAWWLPPIVTVFALAVSLGIGELAPRVRAGWLFTSPAWLTAFYDRRTSDPAPVPTGPRDDPVRDLPGHLRASGRLLTLPEDASIASNLGKVSIMATMITVRNLDDEVQRRLKIRASANDRSMEAEARAILSDAVAGADFAASWLEATRPAAGDALPVVERSAPRDIDIE